MSSPSSEWLEADGRGGFASGTVSGIRTRRYHALLLTATTPPTGRIVLVPGIEVWLETPSARHALSSQRYAPDVVHPDGATRIESFTRSPWPTWRYRIAPDLVVEHELFVRDGTVHLSWRLLGQRPTEARLVVRPLFAGRDYHALHHENPAFDFTPSIGEGLWRWRPYRDVPAIELRANARYEHAPDWYRRFLYAEEQARGLDAVEDLASPGSLVFDLTRGEAQLMLAAGEGLAAACSLDAAREAERSRRAAFDSELERAADAYFVERAGGKTIVAGYPWFTDWGRDTFIALRGLALASGRLADARDILLAWSGEVSEGMLPNRFADQGGSREYNAVDASLWYVIAVSELLDAMSAGSRFRVEKYQRAQLLDAVDAILEGYARGTRHGIRLDGDGLVAAGEPGVQLTWMDAKVGDWVVTPRIGKPVEIQALWLAALAATVDRVPKWRAHLARGRQSFAERFWYREKGYLYDVVDVDHVPGRVDASLRPNQILAVGGLPSSFLDDDKARSVVDTVERELLTPFGLRSLARGEPGYAARYRGGVRERDGAYHQGTVWPWLVGPFVDAWLRVHGDTRASRRDARERFVAPLLEHGEVAGLGHVSEVLDAEAPFTPGGCPFQAWSLGELLRAMSRTDELGLSSRREPSGRSAAELRHSAPR